MLFFSNQNLFENVSPNIGAVTEKKNNGIKVGAHINIISPDPTVAKGFLNLTKESELTLAHCLDLLKDITVSAYSACFILKVNSSGLCPRAKTNETKKGR